MQEFRKFTSPSDDGKLHIYSIIYRSNHANRMIEESMGAPGQAYALVIILWNTSCSFLITDSANNRKGYSEGSCQQMKKWFLYWKTVNFLSVYGSISTMKPPINLFFSSSTFSMKASLISRRQSTKQPTFLKEIQHYLISSSNLSHMVPQYMSLMID